MKLDTSKRVKLLVHTTPWIQRKNLESAFRAYFRMFRAQDDVTLIVHCPIKQDRKFSNTGEVSGSKQVHSDVQQLCERAREESGSTAEVLYLFKDFDLPELPGLYTACQALIHPHRAEGFGMCILEAMACGLPTVTTAWSGNMDYCTPETNLLLPYKLVSGRQTSNLTWAEPDPEPIEWAEPVSDALCDALEFIVTKLGAAAEMGRAAASAAVNWSWRKAAEKLLRLLQTRCGVEEFGTREIFVRREAHASCS